MNAYLLNIENINILMKKKPGNSGFIFFKEI